jgi:outer membrane protein
MNLIGNRRKLWVCMPILLSSIFVHAQEISSNNFTINQVWALADSNSKKLQLQKLNVLVADAKIKQSKAERLPEVSLETEFAHVFELPIYENGLFHSPTQFPVDPKFYEVEAEAYLNIYNGGKTNRAIKVSQVEKELSKINQSQSKQEIHYKAAVYFYDIYRNTSYKELLEQDMRDRLMQLKEINQLYKNGTVLKSDVLRAELRLSKQKMLLTEIENTLTIIRQKLNSLIGREDGLPINAVVTEEETNAVLLTQLEDYITEAKLLSFKIKASNKKHELAELHLKNVKSNILPKFGLFTEYSYAYPQIKLYPYSLSLYSNGMAGIKLDFPITAWYTNQHKVKEAKIKLKQHEIENEDIKDDVRDDVEEYYLRYKESLQRISLAKQNIKQATESYRIVRNTYFNQLALLTDLLEAETEVLQSKFELTTAKVNAKIQYYQLQKAVGKL